ncbi:hypothetical protein GN109_16310 [Collimonas pratensis]|uniref:hypothetical protein n=1 Tax=Collimonas pratensis TaxID=279113 RepID=UPI00143DEB72|nr:hypothetical protein [Collimonas pratensis]NKI70989.1 hypothetical protein [Collimonas pratensis]
MFFMAMVSVLVDMGADGALWIARPRINPTISLRMLFLRLDGFLLLKSKID